VKLKHKEGNENSGNLICLNFWLEEFKIQVLNEKDFRRKYRRHILCICQINLSFLTTMEVA
jgi:hypothetical protein